MPYISTENVKVKRKAIKKAFPNWEFSIRCENHTTINVSILQSPHNVKGHKTINHFYYKDHYKDNLNIMKDLEKIISILDGDNYTASYDGDYGSIPSFYIRVEFGTWEKPHTQIKIN